MHARTTRGLSRTLIPHRRLHSNTASVTWDVRAVCRRFLLPTRQFVFTSGTVHHVMSAQLFSLSPPPLLFFSRARARFQYIYTVSYNPFRFPLFPSFRFSSHISFFSYVQFSVLTFSLFFLRLVNDSYHRLSIYTVNDLIVDFFSLNATVLINLLFIIYITLFTLFI